MELRILQRFVREAEARAELVGADELPHLVEAQAAVDNELVGDLPFVLRIHPGEIAGRRDVVGDVERCIDRRSTDHGLEQRSIADKGLFAAEEKTGADGVRRIDLIRAVCLDAIGKGLAHDVRGDAVDQQIAEWVGRVMQTVIAREIGNLPVEAVDRSLQRQHAVLRVLELVLVEHRRVERGHAERARDTAVQPDRLPRTIGNLKRACRGSRDQAEPRIGVDERRHIGEAFLLLREVVDRAVGWERIFEAFLGLQITADEEVLDAGKAIRTGQSAGSGSRSYRRTGAAERAAVLDRRGERSLTAAVKADLTAVVEDVGAGGDVDEADGSQAVFGRQRAHDQRHAADPAGVENAAEAGQAVGQHDPVDTVLHVGMVVADVKEPACGGVLRHPRGLQQDFLHRLVVAAGKRIDRRVGDDIGGRADGRVEIAAALIEGVGLGVELRRRGYRRRRCGAATCTRRGFGFGFAPETTTSGSFTCALAAPPRAESAISDSKPAQIADNEQCGRHEQT